MRSMPAFPSVGAPLPDTPSSHAFLAADHLQRPIDLRSRGYIFVEKVRASAARLEGERWLTPEDSKAIVQEARAFHWPSATKTSPGQTGQ